MKPSDGNVTSGLDGTGSLGCFYNYMYINHDGPSHLPQEVQLNCSGNGKKNRQWNPRSRTTQRG